VTLVGFKNMIEDVAS